MIYKSLFIHSCHSICTTVNLSTYQNTNEVQVFGSTRVVAALVLKLGIFVECVQHLLLELREKREKKVGCERDHESNLQHYGPLPSGHRIQYYTNRSQILFYFAIVLKFMTTANALNLMLIKLAISHS